MLILPILSLAIFSMANAASTSGNTGDISLLDIITSESAAALKAMIESSPDHSYIKPDLSDVNLLKVFVMNGHDDSIITHMEAATNADAAAYKKAMYGEAGGQSQAEATDPVSIHKRASGCGQYCAYRSQCTKQRECPACYHQYGNTSHQKACISTFGSIPRPTFDSGFK